MTIATPKLIIIGIVLIGSVAGLGFILVDSMVPQYSVYEFFHENDPNSMIGKKIQLVGDAYNVTNDSFVLKDWEGYNYTIKVNYENTPLPSGFEEGKRVMVEGTILKTPDGWVINANLISTKCPSKYVESN